MSSDCEFKWKRSFSLSEDCNRGKFHTASQSISEPDRKAEESAARNMVLRDKVKYLKLMLSSKILQMQDRDHVLHELEYNLARAKLDLTHLEEKYFGKPSFQNLEQTQQETKLKALRDILLCAVFQLEAAMKNMSGCQFCKECTCSNMLYDECKTLDCIKKDLEMLQFGKSPSSRLSKSPISSTELLDCSRTDSPVMEKFNLNAVNAKYVDNFRVKAVTGMAALEEMKDQIDILYGLVKKYYEEIEECENTLDKLRTEFDDITEGLCSIIEELNTVPLEISGRNPCKENIEMRDDENTSEKKFQLLAEQKRLKSEICDHETYLNKVKNDLTQVEKDLSKRRCQLAEQDKEIKSRDEEISKLREGVKGFRERLKDMQIDIAEHLKDKRMIDSVMGSPSNLSILSEELQDLCDILTSSKASFPEIIEKYKEENNQMKEKLCCLEKCLRNKDETLALLQQSLKLRDGQVEDLNCRIQCLDMQIEKSKREAEEKSRLVCNLQDSMKKAKEFELRAKDENIEALQFEICELNHSLKAMMKKVIEKSRELEVLQDEILFVSSKNFYLNREMDFIEPNLDKLHKNLVLYEKMVGHLQNELNSRECEVECLYDKVKSLEKELECELKKCEQRTLEDSQCINELSATITNLRNELDRTRWSKANDSCHCQLVNGNGKDQSEIKNARKALDSSKIVNQQVKVLKRRLEAVENIDCINTKMGISEKVSRQGKDSVQNYKEKINKLQKLLEETTSSHECEKNELIQKLCKEENNNVKNKLLILQLNKTVEAKEVAENIMKDRVKRLGCDLEAVKAENKRLNYELNAANNKCARWKDGSEKKELEKLIGDLESDKSNLQSQLCCLKSELEKEQKLKESLEIRINELKQMLLNKNSQSKQPSKSCKGASPKPQETIPRRKNGEDRHKCMKQDTNMERCMDDDDFDDDAEELRNKQKCLENCLEAKTAEVSNLMSQLQCLQAKMKTMQSEFLSTQANKDCELSRLNREICRLESELDLVEKENGKLRKDFKKIQDELNNKSMQECSLKEECDKKERELNSVRCEKKKLMGSIDDLQKRLEELCLDNTKREAENRSLMDECEKLKKELGDVECELSETRREVDDLKCQYNDAMENLKCSEKKRNNLEKLYCNMNEEISDLQSTKNNMEKEICEALTENSMLKEKLLCAKKEREREKLMAENSGNSQDKAKYCAMIKDLSFKLKNMEEKVIPELEEEICRKDRFIEGYKMELDAANRSNQKMRDDSMRVIQCTRKYLKAQRCANEANRCSRNDCSHDNKYSTHNDPEDLNEQLKSVARMNETLYADLQNEKIDFNDVEPRSYSPSPWGYSNVDRDGSSPEYLPESGFQSMQQSPTNMSCMNDCYNEVSRTSSQWKNVQGRRTDVNDYSSCRR